MAVILSLSSPVLPSKPPPRPHRMDSRRLSRSNSAASSMQESLGSHKLDWLRADQVCAPRPLNFGAPSNQMMPSWATVCVVALAQWADYRRLTAPDNHVDLSDADLQRMVQNARRTWARVHQHWDPNSDGERRIHVISPAELSHELNDRPHHCLSDLTPAQPIFRPGSRETPSPRRAHHPRRRSASLPKPPTRSS